MPLLTTPQELLAALGSSALAADPLADLKKRGYTLSDALTRQWLTAVAARKSSNGTQLTLQGTHTFQALIAPLVPAPPAPSGYDIVAGLRLSAANQALSAVYDSGTIPHQFALDQLLSATELTALGGAFIVDKPGGQISRLHITSAPTVNSIDDGTNIVAVQFPIQIDWTRTITLISGKVRQIVTVATGTLQLTMKLVASVIVRQDLSSSTMTISLQLLTDESPVDTPRLTLDPHSPVQLKNPVPPNQIDGFAILIQNALASQFKNGLSFTISPHFPLPPFGAVDFTRADVIVTGGVIVAGLQVVGGTPGTPNPANLTNLLPDSTSNVFVQTQEIVINLLLQQAQRNGSLTAQAKQQYSNGVVDSATASMQNNSFVLVIHGRLVDECPLNVDLAFVRKRTITISEDPNAQTIQIDQHDDDSIFEASNLWCLLTSLGFAGLAAALGFFIGGVYVAIGSGVVEFFLSQVGRFLLSKLKDAIEGGGGGGDSSVLDLTLPIPGSDALPTLDAPILQVTTGSMLIAATAGVQPDKINTILYVRFVVHDSSIEVFSTKALAGVVVQLMDQDTPAPPGDDASTKTPPNTSGGIGKHASSTTYTFNPPHTDQILATGTTDLDGTVRFALTVDQLTTTAGTITAAVTRFDADETKQTTTKTNTPVTELKPDLYFRVTMPDGSVVDTRNLTGGFMVNFTSARIGTLSNPLIFTLGPGPSSTGTLETAHT